MSKANQPNNDWWFELLRCFRKQTETNNYVQIQIMRIKFIGTVYLVLPSICITKTMAPLKNMLYLQLYLFISHIYQHIQEGEGS